jgi:hypothetical protein
VRLRVARRGRPACAVENAPARLPVPDPRPQDEPFSRHRELLRYRPVTERIDVTDDGCARSGRMKRDGRFSDPVWSAIT